MNSSTALSNPLDTARRKVYLRALPLLFVCYIIAYVDRNNVSIAQLTMPNSLPEFTKAVIGFGSGVFFLGYFLLEIPGTLIVERWSASKWICRIMVTWGLVAAMTAFVTKPYHFYGIRFLLGLAEAGFFPGVIVYLTHWFPKRDRARAISIFLIATPIAMIIGNYSSTLLLNIGELHGPPPFLGLKGWQCIFIFWGIPAVIMGIVVVLYLTDRPKHAKWLTEAERDALEGELEKERREHKAVAHMSVWEGLMNPNVLMLCLAYFGVVTGNYGIELFLPSILEDWYGLSNATVGYLAMIPSVFVIMGQLGIGWSSDHFGERRWHAILPIVIGALGLITATLTQGNLVLTVICFTVAATGMKAYMPAFWSLPNMYLTAAAAAGSIGLINSVGNLGGFLGPTVVGKVKTLTGSYDIALYFLATTCLVSSGVVFLMPYIYKRLSNTQQGLAVLAARLQMLGALTILIVGISLAGNAWVSYQLRPWGLARQELQQSPTASPAYYQQLAGSLEDWFAKRPQIRDALVFRIDQLTAGITDLAKLPGNAPNTALVQRLNGAVDKMTALKKRIGEKDATKGYLLSVASAREQADEVVRQLQNELKGLP